MKKKLSKSNNSPTSERGETARFGISMERKLLQQLDQALRAKHYANRSEAIRDLVRDFLVNEYVDAQQTTAEKQDPSVVGTLTLVYNHNLYALNARLTALQHTHHDLILSAMHVHLDIHHCLEVLVIRGPASTVRDISNQIIGTHGVLHGKLTTTIVSADFL